MKEILYLVLFSVLLLSCNSVEKSTKKTKERTKNNYELVVLGTVQDAGSPQAGCKKECCIHLWEAPEPNRKVVSLGIIDHLSKKTYMIEASPDFKDQLYQLNKLAGFDHDRLPDGIFLTHAHIGHYTGLLQLGRESIGAKKVPVYAMPRMRNFIENNGPWSQLVDLGNIHLMNLRDSTNVLLSQDLSIMPFLVPHRDEFSETCGFVIRGINSHALFIPDIDKWSKWNHPIEEVVSEVDLAFIDATFYSDDELPGRDMSEIPHPFVLESMKLFDSNESLKSKIQFIHLNHTNPLLNSESEAFKKVVEKGYHIASYSAVYGL